MKKIVYILGTIIVLGFCYFYVNLIFFDSWTRYSAEKEINNYISNHDTKKLKEISANNKTYQLLKHTKHVTIKGDTDNQGGGHIGYFTSTINGKEGALFALFLGVIHFIVIMLIYLAIYGFSHRNQ